MRRLTANSSSDCGPSRFSRCLSGVSTEFFTTSDYSRITIIRSDHSAVNREIVGEKLVGNARNSHCPDKGRTLFALIIARI